MDKAKLEVEAAVSEAETTASPDPTDIFAYTWSKTPPYVQREKQALVDFLSETAEGGNDNG